MTESEQESAPTHRRRPSPRYPAVDLPTAVSRTVDLYKASPNHPIALATAAELWGFSRKSSSSKVTAASLKYFGLVQDVGSGAARQLELTPEGRELAFLNRDREHDRWDELIKDAALNPRLFSQVIDHFGYPLPDERVVLRHLVFELGFPDEPSAQYFIRRLTATMEFAGFTNLEAGDLVSAPEPPPGHSQWDSGSPPTRDDSAAQNGPRRPGLREPAGSRQGEPAAPGIDVGFDPGDPPPRSIYDHFRADVSHVNIPLSPGRWARLEAAFPLDEDQWTMLVSVLQAMKPALVRPAKTDPRGASSDADTDDD